MNLLNKKNIRDGSMDALKFFLAIAIILFHGKKIYRGDASVLFDQGASAVECFFIISGYYMAKTAIERRTDSFEFMKRRWLSIFPFHLYAFLIAFCVKAYQSHFLSAFSLHNLKEIGLLGIRALPEFLMLPPLAGLEYELSGINNMEWYLSALLLGMAILYPIIKKYPRQFCSYIGPLIFLFFSGWLYQHKGTYRTTVAYGNYISLGLIRALALLSAGAVIFWFVTQAREQRAQRGKEGYSKKAVALMTGVSIVSWIIVFGFFNSHLPKNYCFSVVYFMLIGVYLEGIKGTAFSSIFNNRFASFLGKISLPMYLNQGYVRRIMYRMKLPWSYAKCMLVYLAITFLISLVCLLLIDLYKMLKKRRAEKQLPA